MDELLAAVVAADFGGVATVVDVHPGAVDAASDALARRLAHLTLVPEFGTVAPPDLDPGAVGLWLGLDMRPPAGIE